MFTLSCVCFSFSTHPFFAANRRFKTIMWPNLRLLALEKEDDHEPVEICTRDRCVMNALHLLPSPSDRWYFILEKKTMTPLLKWWNLYNGGRQATSLVSSNNINIERQRQIQLHEYISCNCRYSENSSSRHPSQGCPSVIDEHKCSCHRSSLNITRPQMFVFIAAIIINFIISLFALKGP